MHRLRLFFFLLLALTVPLQGYAYFAQPLVPCPMEDSAMMAMADAATHDCCDDAEPAGKVCKSGQPCHSGGQHFSSPMPAVLPQVTVPATRFPRVTMRTASFDPAATWRPPAQF